MYSDLLMTFPGKTSVETTDWLPLWMHCKDAAETITYLLDNWLPDHVKRACKMDGSDFQKLCVFLAFAHDIGKLTPIFAARILEKRPEARQKLEQAGLKIGSLREYVSGNQ